MVRLNTIKHAFLVVFVFLFVFNPHIFGIAAHIYLLPISFIYIVLNVSLYYNIISNKYIFFYLISILFSAIYCLAIDMAFNASSIDSTFFWRFLTYFISLSVIATAITIFFKKENWNSEQVISLFVKIAVIQSIFAVVMILIPEIRPYIYDNILMYTKEFRIYDKYIFSRRAFGITQDYLFSMPLFIGWALLMVFVKAVLQRRFINLFLYVPIFIIVILYNARIGLILIPIGLICYYYYYGYKLKKYTNLYITSILLIVSLSSFYLLFFHLGEVLKLFINNSTIRMTIEGFILGDGIYHYIDVLSASHIHLPDSFLSWIFGEGNYLFSNPRSDIGYINYLYFGGIILSLILYVPILILSYKLIRKNNIEIKIILSSAILMIFVANIKGLIIGSNDFMLAVSLLMIFLFSNKNK